MVFTKLIPHINQIHTQFTDYRIRMCQKITFSNEIGIMHVCMVGAQAYYEYLAGHTAGMELNACAQRSIDLG